MLRRLRVGRLFLQGCLRTCRSQSGGRFIVTSTNLNAENHKWSYSAGKTTIPLLTKTIDQALDDIVEKYPDRISTVFHSEDTRWTYQEMREKAHQVSAGLAAIGIHRGDRVGLMAPNMKEYVVLTFALARMGAILVTINPAYKTNELEYALRLAGCKALIAPDKYKVLNYQQMVMDIVPELQSSKPGQLKSKTCPDLRHVVFISEDHYLGAWRFQDVVEAGDSSHHKQVASLYHKIQFDDPAQIMFTGGTTGAPKGTVLSHYNMVNNSNITGHRLGFHNYKDGAIVCSPAPYFHVSGMVVITLSAMMHGGKAVMPSQGFDPLRSLQCFQDEKCQVIGGVTTMYIDYINHPQFDTFDFSHVQSAVIGGSDCPEELMRQIVNKFGLKGLSIIYGMTEVTALATATDPMTDSLERQLTTVGKVVEHIEYLFDDSDTPDSPGKRYEYLSQAEIANGTQMKIVNEYDEIVPVGVAGEVYVRGFTTMLEYWKNEEKTKETKDKAGWVHTGDSAVMDEEGYYRIVGRIKDMIIRGGENIFPAEVEAFLLTHEKIQAAQVVGVPDERLQEEICACVVLRQGQTVTEEEIRNFCKGNISHQKVPRYYLIMDSFPLSPAGKVQKYVLKCIAREQLGL